MSAGGTVLQDDLRSAAVGGVVEVDGGSLRGLYGVLGLQISLLQRDGRQRDFAVRYVCEFGVQVDPHGDRGSDLVRVEALEGFTYVGLLADDVERGHGFADGADVDVLVRIAFILFGDVVGVEHGQIFVASLLCQADIVRVAVENAAGVAFFVAYGGEDQVAFQLIQVFFHQRCGRTVFKCHKIMDQRIDIQIRIPQQP